MSLKHTDTLNFLQNSLKKCYLNVCRCVVHKHRNKTVLAPLNWCYKQVLGTKWRGQWQLLSTSHLFPCHYPVLNMRCTLVRCFFRIRALSHTQKVSLSGKADLKLIFPPASTLNCQVPLKLTPIFLLQLHSARITDLSHHLYL